MPTQTPTERVAGNVRAEMSRANVSQIAMAKHLGIGQSSVSRRLRGELPFDVAQLHVIADVVGVSVEALLADRAPVAA